MKCILIGYLFLLVWVLGECSHIKSSRSFVERRRKSFTPKRHLRMIGWSSAHSEPEFVGVISGIKIVVGKDAILRCVVENLGDYKIAWSLVGKHGAPNRALSIGTSVLEGNDRIQVTANNSSSWYLHIQNVTRDDTGFYACQITTNQLKSQVGYLEVVEPPEFVNNLTNRNVTVYENQNVTLNCKATGNPEPEIKWTREDGQSFLLGKERVTEYFNDELTIISVDRDHMAAYLCLASNEVPPAISRRFYLDVKFPPLIYIQNQLIGAREGADVYLECNTEAHPISENYWKRKDELFVSKSSRYRTEIKRNFYKTQMRLKIREIQQEDYGTYQCVAKNDISETTGTIHVYKALMPAPTSPKPVTERIKPVYPTWRTITVPSTTERRIIYIDIDRKENSYSPGTQQKYGHEIALDDDQDEDNATSSIQPKSMDIFSALILSMFVRIYTTCYR